MFSSISGKEPANEVTVTTETGRKFRMPQVPPTSESFRTFKTVTKKLSKFIKITTSSPKLPKVTSVPTLHQKTPRIPKLPQMPPEARMLPEGDSQIENLPQDTPSPERVVQIASQVVRKTCKIIFFLRTRVKLSEIILYIDTNNFRYSCS